MPETRLTRSAAKRANWVRELAVRGVVRLPKFMIVAMTRMPRKSPAAAMDWSA